MYSASKPYHDRSPNLGSAWHVGIKEANANIYVRAKIWPVSSNGLSGDNYNVCPMQIDAASSEAMVSDSSLGQICQVARWPFSTGTKAAAEAVSGAVLSSSTPTEEQPALSLAGDCCETVDGDMTPQHRSCQSKDNGRLQQSDTIRAQDQAELVFGGNTYDGKPGQAPLQHSIEQLPPTAFQSGESSSIGGQIGIQQGSACHSMGLWRQRRLIKGTAGNSRGRGGRNRMIYLSLSGHTLTGRAAVEQSRVDRAKLERKQTFTDRQEEIRQKCLKAQEHCVARQDACMQEDRAALSWPGWGIPEIVCQSYEQHGIKRLFPWQVQCLEAGEGRVVQEGRNLVYSAPTSGGKTMVAELLMLRALTHATQCGTALYVVPFKALAEEKARYFRQIWAGLDLGVKSFHSDAVDVTLSEDVHVAICTIERANALVNRLLVTGQLHVLRIIVVDEMHMIGDDRRGYLIEVLLAKLRMASLMACSHRKGPEGRDFACLFGRTQIIGLSATLPNLPQISQWLDAELFVTTHRPVHLSLMICHGRTLERADEMQDGGGRPDRVLALRDNWQTDDGTSATIHLCLEVVSEGQGVLVFCPSRSWAQNCAARISEAMQRSKAAVCTHPHLATKRTDLLEQLRLAPVGLAPELSSCIPQGVAFHHAGLTLEERTLLEDAFRAGVLLVLSATTTLAAGVNLPARRVIIRDRKTWNSQELSPAEFQQMCGRAGRLGHDAYGEAILISRVKEVEAGRKFIRRPLAPMTSVLDRGHGGGIERALLELVVGRLACCSDWLALFARSTLYLLQQSSDQRRARFAQAYTYLLSHHFITGRPGASEIPKTKLDEQRLKQHMLQAATLYGTQFGIASFLASMAPYDATDILASLRLAISGGLNLASDIHLVFLCIPPNRRFFVPDWTDLSRRYTTLTEEVETITQLLGIQESVLATLRDRPPRDAKDEALLTRFVYALTLNDMLQEVPLMQLGNSKITRGGLQQLRVESRMFCGMVITFARELKWTSLARLLTTLGERLEHGVSEELLPLCRIGPDLVHALRARALFNAGFEDPAALAEANSEDVVRALISSVPFAPAMETWIARSSSNVSLRCQRSAERLAEAVIRRAQAIVEQERQLNQPGHSSSVSRASEMIAERKNDRWQLDGDYE